MVQTETGCAYNRTVNAAKAALIPRVMELYRMGVKYKRIAEDVGCSPGTASKWVKDYEARTPRMLDLARRVSENHVYHLFWREYLKSQDAPDTAERAEAYQTGGSVPQC